MLAKFRRSKKKSIPACLETGFVRVRATLLEDRWLFSSDDIDGFFMSGSDFNRIHQDIPNVIRLLMKANYGLDVEVKLSVPASQLRAQHRKATIQAPSKETTEVWTTLLAAA